MLQSSKTSIGFGVVIAMILSFDRNHSILWMIWHGLCGWIYAIYRGLGY